jgi:ribosomal protein S18 acetylase RimI-like enzyme
VPDVEVRPLAPAERAWARSVLVQAFGSPSVVSHGVAHDALALSGYVAVEDGEPVGLATYRIEGEECELVTLNSVREGRGIGTRLLDAVREQARERGCRRLWLITTNDNTRMLRFSQRRGFRLAALRPGAIDEYRRTLKPEIGATGFDGIPIRDELELELEP